MPCAATIGRPVPHLQQIDFNVHILGMHAFVLLGMCARFGPPVHPEGQQLSVTTASNIHSTARVEQQLRACIGTRRTCAVTAAYLEDMLLPVMVVNFLEARGVGWHAAGHRVLLFSQMTRALDVIQDYLDLRTIPHLRLDGTTKSEDRSVSQSVLPFSSHLG